MYLTQLQRKAPTLSAGIKVHKEKIQSVHW